jgi:hypothetical protein
LSKRFKKNKTLISILISFAKFIAHFIVQSIRLESREARPQNKLSGKKPNPLSNEPQWEISIDRTLRSTPNGDLENQESCATWAGLLIR